MVGHAAITATDQRRTPPSPIAVPLPKGCLLLLTERVYLAGLRLGRTLRMGRYRFGCCSRGAAKNASTRSRTWESVS